jgi:hypothetical protein
LIAAVFAPLTDGSTDDGNERIANQRRLRYT